jgi:hypothetical protein
MLEAALENNTEIEGMANKTMFAIIRRRETLEVNYFDEKR